MTVVARATVALACAILARALTQSERATVTYEGVPVAVRTIQVFEWQDAGVPRRVSTVIDRRGQSLAIKAPPGFERLVLFQREDGQYLIDGPFTWPEADRARTVPGEWRFTVTGTTPDTGSSATTVAWISPHQGPTGWPRCLIANDRQWQCWGSGAMTRGVVSLASPSSFRWALLEGASTSALHDARWGRMLTISGTETTTEEVEVAFRYPVAPPAERLASMRLDTAVVAGAESVSLAANTTWIAAAATPPLAWVEVSADSAGPTYISMLELSEGPSTVPVLIRLPPRRTLSGIVTAAGGKPAAGALVTLFRAIDPAATASAPLKARRVFVSEKTTDAEGAFSIDGLGEADYEVVAWHPQLGRDALALNAMQGSVTLALRTAGLANGRVIVNGKPVAGVDVISVPDAATFNTVKDLTEVKGGDARTGVDGRFGVSVASAGGGELRIGGGKYAIKRVPLPRPAVPLLELGDIDLAAAIELTILLDRETPCVVRAIGPIGRTGLQVVSAVRSENGAWTMAVPEPGVWQFGLACSSGEKQTLAPSSVQISPAHAGKELRFVVSRRPA